MKSCSSFAAESKTHRCRTPGQKDPSLPRVRGSHRGSRLRSQGRQAVDQTDPRRQGPSNTCFLQHALNIRFHALLTQHQINVGDIVFILFFLCFLQAAIRKELNDYKSTEMEVHEESRIYTRYLFS